MATSEISSPDPEPVKKENALIIEQANSLAVMDVPSHELGQQMWQALSQREKIVKDLFMESKDAANKAHKAISALEKRLLEPLGTAKVIVASKCRTFKSAMEAAARVKEAALAEQARKAEEERLLADAIEAEASGDKKAAEEILAEPVTVPMIRVEAQIAHVAGIGGQKRWKCVIDNAVELVQYIAANPSKIELLETEKLIESHPSLNRLAIALKAGFSIPGCRAVEEEGMTNRG